jgi:hypothetical protein
MKECYKYVYINSRKILIINPLHALLKTHFYEKYILVIYMVTYTHIHRHIYIRFELKALLARQLLYHLTHACSEEELHFQNQNKV